MNVLRLIKPNGQPTTTTDDHDFLREMFRYDQEELSEAMLVFTQALLAEDPAAIWAGVTQLESVVFLMGERKRRWWRERMA